MVFQYPYGNNYACSDTVKMGRGALNGFSCIIYNWRLSSITMHALFSIAFLCMLTEAVTRAVFLYVYNGISEMFGKDPPRGMGCLNCVGMNLSCNAKHRKIPYLMWVKPHYELHGCTIMMTI
ncbi:hypothetical protein KP509_01G069600 [Ceratopteris richardii]|uniref:Uncharacterized protein n=1 Tax=Ceratopteris richardii TaxID=49495 RepID=A0A8T2VMB7_CERRI|nr:hypothetical protein KP509_01G069600 [Ceratopteris richardii]